MSDNKPTDESAPAAEQHNKSIDETRLDPRRDWPQTAPLPAKEKLVEASVQEIAQEYAELLHRPHISLDSLRDGITKAINRALATASSPSEDTKHLIDWTELRDALNLPSTDCDKQLVLHKITALQKQLNEVNESIMLKGAECAADLTGDPEITVKDVEEAWKAINECLRLGGERNNELNELRQQLAK